MTLLAAGGLFFNEWYRDPIFRALYALPFIGIVAFGTAFAVRPWVRPPGPRILPAVGIIVVGTAVVLGGGLWNASGQHARESRAVARTIDFTTYEPPPRG